MATRLYTQTHWSAEDDQMLRSLAEAGKSLTLMTVKLKKPMNSICSRAQALQVNIAGTNIGKKRAIEEPSVGQRRSRFPVSGCR